ncbi:rhodanese-like domain-containing protein [Cyanobium sp. NIES-981]|uniref:rhodanese-like domain-containing protein n=1 Tax=Cyanobium sp. NIES-981 TaxID=1851505 RepID=UPI0007DCF363|nr:rhodanese-like domain-containing protein [Cyanobium sp. NIES-981]SBO44123.1 Rhodanese-like domain protein [Cyanobium sp. NIES-981]
MGSALTLVALLGCGGPSGRSTSDAQRAELVERLYADFRRARFADVPDITVAELQRQTLQHPQLVLVDVRELRERAVSILPGAISVEVFERQKERYRSSLVVPYCTIGLRSGLYGRRLIREGFRTRNLAGSLLAWAHAGLPLEHQGRPTRRAHVFSPGWNLLPEAYEAAVN